MSELSRLSDNLTSVEHPLVKCVQDRNIISLTPFHLSLLGELVVLACSRMFGLGVSSAFSATSGVSSRVIRSLRWSAGDWRWVNQDFQPDHGLRAAVLDR